MSGKSSQTDPAIALARVTLASSSAELVREHLGEIVGSPAFKGSRRSQEFLLHIVEKALQGETSGLKERVLGVELFGRAASYDTREDAIVRVTACDLRRRLQQYYAAAEAAPMRIDLPAGSYLPEFRWPAAPAEAAPDPRPRRRWLARAAAVAAAVLLVSAAGGVLARRHLRPAGAAGAISPWPALLSREAPTRIVFCDPDISLVQRLVGFRITLSDYANRRYVPEGRTLDAELAVAVDGMRGTKVTYADSVLAMDIAQLAATAGYRVKTHTARSLQLLDFKTDDNFILFGSPRSNPWFTLFDERLDFRFDHDAGTDQEIVVNQRPRAGEAARYLPTAQGGGTGQAYAVVALLDNPGQKGHVLLLAGSNAEATEAAGRMVTDLDRLPRELAAHGIDPSHPRPFELLLRVSTMAGSPNTFEVVACHVLGG